MKRTLSIVCALCLSTAAFGQADDGKGVMMNPEGKYDLLSQAWQFEDADPLETGTFDLRFGLQWSTGRTLGDSSDNFVVTPSIVWGFAEDWELSLGVDAWLGDGGNMGPFRDGNYDTHLGLLWRFHEQQPFMARKGELHLPSMALSSTMRIPTGDGSSGIDAELRFIATYEYTSGVRSHFNIFGKTANGNNLTRDNVDFARIADDLGLREIIGDFRDLDSRHFQYGMVLGADGPMGCENLRWVADYMFRSSFLYGNSSLHIGEFGFEWEMTETSKLGVAVQANMDHTDDTPEWGANIVYAYSIRS
jgi:hypothetical protein